MITGISERTVFGYNEGGAAWTGLPGFPEDLSLRVIVRRDISLVPVFLGDTMTDESRRGDNETTEYLTEFDPQEESVSEKLVMTIAALENVSPIDLPILHDFVDSDALNAYFNTCGDGTGPSSDRVVSFTYIDYEVRIHSAGTITLCAPE